VRWLEEIRRPEILKRHGHYEIAFGPRSRAHMQAHAAEMAREQVNTLPMSAEQLAPLQHAANEREVAGLHFLDTAHVIDPLEAVRAFAASAMKRNARFRQMEVKALQPRGDKIEVFGGDAPLIVDSAVVCAGVHSAPLLAPFGLRAPLQAVRGYHIEIPGHPAFLDAPVVYTDQRIIITPMSGRLRATSYMEFADADASSDARKPLRLRRQLRALGYACDADGTSWVGSRPALPDYLPGIGRAAGSAKLFYAVGHQHIGLTLAPVSADLVADIVAERSPHLALAAYDLRRFS
jgi:D-amino-acid dehydrogenase